VNKHTLATF